MSAVSVIFLIIIAIETSLLWVILSGSKTRSAKMFALFLGTHMLWVYLHAIVRGFDPHTSVTIFKIASVLGVSSAERIATFLMSSIYFSGLIVSIAFYFFTIVFPHDTKPPKYIVWAIGVGVLAIAPLFFSGYIVSGTEYIGGIQGWMWLYGRASYLFDVLFMVFWILGLHILYTKSTTANVAESTNLRFMFWAMFIGIIPAGLCNVFLPRIEFFLLDWFGPITGLGWIGLLSYSIFKFRQMNIRTVTAQILIISMMLILFFNIFISSFTKGRYAGLETTVKTVVFIAFMSVGRILITNILKEAERKKQVEELNNKMKVLHDTLEETVVERTREFAEAKINTETILENLTLGIVEYDEDFTILRLNRATEHLLGIERGAVVGNILQPKDLGVEKLSSLTTVLYPTLSEDGKKVTSKEEFEENLLKNEITVAHPKKRELQVITLPLKSLYTNEKPRFVKLIRDVTHENLVDRSKSEFIKIAAHQLRTPLAGAKWALRATLDEDLGPVSLEQKKLLQRLYDTNKNLIDIVNDLLDVTNIEESSGYHKSLNNIVEIIQEAVLSSLLLAKDKKVHVSFEKPTSEVELFTFDKIKILIAIKNIIINSLDHVHEGGTIIITLNQVDRFMNIVIVDNGTGISKDDYEHLFTRFYRSKDSIQNMSYRSGLGLYVAKDIITEHGGHINVASQEGSGTTVTLQLPIPNPSPTTI